MYNNRLVLEDSISACWSGFAKALAHPLRVRSLQPAHDPVRYDFLPNRQPVIVRVAVSLIILYILITVTPLQVIGDHDRLGAS